MCPERANSEIVPPRLKKGPDPGPFYPSSLVTWRERERPAAWQAVHHPADSQDLRHRRR